jgi:hypothetical protein
VPPGEATRLDPDDDQFYDYTDRAPLNIKIPSYSHSADGSFVQFHVHHNDELVALRYKSSFFRESKSIEGVIPSLSLLAHKSSDCFPISRFRLFLESGSSR